MIEIAANPKATNFSLLNSSFNKENPPKAVIKGHIIYAKAADFILILFTTYIKANQFKVIAIADKTKSNQNFNFGISAFNLTFSKSVLNCFLLNREMDNQVMKHAMTIL